MINADDSLRPVFNWQEPGEYVRDDQARLETSAVDPKTPSIARRSFAGLFAD